MRKAYLSVGASAVFALAVAGCKSTPYEGQRDLVKIQLDQAEEAGASKGELEGVRETLRLAQEEEKRAGIDQKEARDDLAWARNELPAAQSRFNELQRRNERIQRELTQVQEDLREVEQEQNDLVDRGLSSEQVNAIVGMRRGLMIKRQSELQTEASTISDRLELARLDRQAAEEYIQAAEHRLEAAQARIALSSQLYTLADQQGRSLEAEALRAKRGELGESIYLTPVEPYETSTQPAGFGEQGTSQPAGFEQGQQPKGVQQQPVTPQQPVAPQQPTGGQQQPNR